MDEEQTNNQIGSETEPQAIGNAVADDSSAGRSRWHRFKAWYGSHKKISIPVSVILMAVILTAIPWSRYHTAGLVLKNDLGFLIIDSTAETPVSGADVSLGSSHTITDAEGRAIFHNVRVGNHVAKITKKYYKDQEIKVLAPIRYRKSASNIMLEATGRQARITIKDLINQKVLGDVEIKAAGASAKTDKDGTAVVVLPAGTTEEEAAISVDGYNEAKVKVKASSSEIKQNDFNLTPSGKVYFLSKLSGRIDVVKTNLDGSGRKTVLAGTGSEDDGETVLLASKDWKYLALKADRSGQGDVLYIIDTSNDQLSTIDQTRGGFTIIGWQDDYFVYTLERNNQSAWRPGQQVLKSYQVSTGKLVPLSQTKAAGTSDDDYARESFEGNYHLAGSSLLFAKTWDFGSTSSKLAPTQASSGLYSIGLDGNNFRTLKTFSHLTDQFPEDDYLDTNYYYIYSYLSKPNIIIYRVSNSNNEKDRYFKYVNGQLAEDKLLSKTFDKGSSSYVSYLPSPSGRKTFWSESRDGKNSLFVGDTDGASAKQAASLSDYQPYGWYSDDYLLVSKKSSELYIMPAEGIKSDPAAVKITDYHKADYNYYGYGRD